MEVNYSLLIIKIQNETKKSLNDISMRENILKREKLEKELTYNTLEDDKEKFEIEKEKFKKYKKYLLGVDI